MRTNYKLVVVLKHWESRFLNPSKSKTHPKTWNLAWFHDMAHICRGKKNRPVWEKAHTLVANEVLFETKSWHVNITNGCIILTVSKINHTRCRVCSCLIRRDKREKSAMQARWDTCEQSTAQARRDACVLSTLQARRDTCEQQGLPCSPGSELFDLHAPAAARLAHNFFTNGLIKALGRRVFACDPMAAFSLFMFSTRIPA